MGISIPDWIGNFTALLFSFAPRPPCLPHWCRFLAKTKLHVDRHRFIWDRGRLRLQGPYLPADASNNVGRGESCIAWSYLRLPSRESRRGGQTHWFLDPKYTPSTTDSFRSETTKLYLELKPGLFTAVAICRLPDVVSQPALKTQAEVTPVGIRSGKLWHIVSEGDRHRNRDPTEGSIILSHGLSEWERMRVQSVCSRPAYCKGPALSESNRSH